LGGLTEVLKREPDQLPLASPSPIENQEIS